MESELLKTAYSAEEFRKQGHRWIDLLADHIDNSIQERNERVINWQLPEDERQFWNHFLKGGDPENLPEIILQRCIHIHNPRYMGHQISPIVPITSLTNLLSAVLNNGMGIYEMGAAPTAMERVVTDELCKAVGYNTNANGFLTSGGTLANLTALLSARQHFLRNQGIDFDRENKLSIMVSEEAHYCIARAAKIMGLGEEGIIKIPVDSEFKMRTDLLDTYLQSALSNGRLVLAIVGSAPSTATGIYDDLDKIAKWAKKHSIWFHVDGAHGGAAVFSAKHKELISGMQNADSIVIDGHKMMMMPSITTALLFKDGRNSHMTFRQKADYLLEESEEEDWYNLAKRTFECTKYMMSLHWYALIKTYGLKIFDEFVTRLYDLAREFALLVKEDPDFELAVQPMSNILCFRYIGPSRHRMPNNELNRLLRQRVLEEGIYYIVQTKLGNEMYLRTTIMNPFSTADHFNGLLTHIKSLAQE